MKPTRLTPICIQTDKEMLNRFDALNAKRKGKPSRQGRIGQLIASDVKRGEKGARV